MNIIGGTDLTLPMVNELMTAVTDQYGRDSHVIMGAVIDEGMQQRLEVCVLGTTESAAASHSQAPWRSRPAARGAVPEPARTAGEEPTGARAAPAAAARPSRTNSRSTR